MQGSRWLICVCLLLGATTARADTSVALFSNTSYPGGWGSGLATTVQLPPASAMQTFNSMSVLLALGCPSSGCPPWDFVASLYVCDNADSPSASTCTKEIARWVTPYGVPGAWITDISPALAMVQGGGKQAFWFSTPQAYVLNGSITLGHHNTGNAPSRAIPLWGGGNLDLSYNPSHQPITINVANQPAKAQIFTLVTGHGWGNTEENCAEFCDISHHFGVGGRDYSVDFPNAGSATGCQDLVPEGVVPNQAGTWEYGRDGWCPGWDVKPFVPDVTQSLAAGKNTLTYEALYNGQPYNPTYVSNPQPNAINPSINMASYLVIWDTLHQAPSGITLASNTGYCIDIPHSNSYDGAPVQTWSCNGTGAQQFTYNGGQLTGLGKCLQAMGTTSTSPIQLQDCSNAAGQQWVVSGTQIMLANTNLCIDVPSNNPSVNPHLWVYTCNGTGAQAWMVPGISSGNLHATADVSYCLDVRSSSTSEGATVQVYPCNGTGAQEWTVGGGRVSALGRCIGVTALDAGTPVGLYSCTETNGLTFQQNGQTLQLQGTSMCLDVPGNNPSPAKPIQLWGCNGTGAQKWPLE